MDEGRARAIADRRTGIGCDQLILLEPSDVADVRMRIWNADGGEVEACGNAARCVALLEAARRSIETEGGIIPASANGSAATIDMGEPRFGWDEIPLAYRDGHGGDAGRLGGAAGSPFAVNVGNPHVVFFVEDADAVDLARLGPLIEHDPLFPERVNVNVASIEDDAIRLRVWERGAGLTLACGTGACATAVAAICAQAGASPVEVRLPGGPLIVEWAPGGTIRMSGPASHVFNGELPSMSGPEIITLGCRLNAAESEAMRALAAGQDDLVIVNSCAVTNEAVRQTRQAIRKAKRARPDARVVVTGCAAQIEPATFAAMPEVARVIGNREKFEAASFLAGEIDVRVSDIMAVRETAPHLVAGFAERARAFVEVQNGCDHRCTFCIIPYGRGNSRSVPAGLVVERIRALVGEGFREVVLTGVDVTSYGADLPGAPTLGLLIERILPDVPELPRLRLSSLDCIEIDERLVDIAAGEPRFMPHLHMSFQAGDDMVLKRMKRRHSRAEAVETVARLKARRPEIAIGADLIAGFPTETEAMHGDSLRLIDECDIVMGHIFPFSPKRGTPAARMPHVEPELVKARARRLREATARRKAAWLQGLVGTRQRVLVEREEPGSPDRGPGQAGSGPGGSGHAENFAPVRVTGASIGKIVAATITGVEGDKLVGAAA